MNKYSKVVVALAVMLIASGVGFSSAFGYGGSGNGETLRLRIANSWTIMSPSTKLSAFNYNSADISSILTYNASNGAFEVASASDLLEPVNAFYMLPNKATSVSFNYEVYTETIPGMSSKNLFPGWNLVGTNTEGPAIDEFSTISSASTLHVPETRNGYKDVTGSSWGNSADRDIDKTNWKNSGLSSRDGYWIYLTNPATYTKILK
ncbi:hypothetical protein KJ671_00845 [Patescibacteria group bacterium]|nr:hypothetical protein [Patescibacteria group bacterium]